MTPAQLSIGMVVRSTCGRDRKRVFILIDIDEENLTAPAVIANGTLRKIGDRKHKNPAHLTPVAVLGELQLKALSDDMSDGQIAEFCGLYDISEK